jgi:hypothetical protein
VNSRERVQSREQEEAKKVRNPRQSRKHEETKARKKRGL